MNREKRNAPKPKRFCTTSSNDEILSQRKVCPKMQHLFKKIKMELNKKPQPAYNEIRQQTIKPSSMENFGRKKLVQTSKIDIMENSGEDSSIANSLDDSSRHNFMLDTMSNSRQQTTRVQSPSLLCTHHTPSSRLLNRYNPQTQTSSQTGRLLNFPSEQLQNDETQYSTYDQNSHLTIETQSFHEENIQSDILLPEERPHIHSIVSQLNRQPPQSNKTHTPSGKLNVSHSIAQVSSTRQEEQNLTLMKIEEYVLNKLPEEFRLIHEALSRIEQKQKLKPKRYSGIPQKPKCLPIGNMEQFKAFEKINNEEFETVVSYFEYLGATLQNITPLLKASLDDGFSHTFTWYGNNEKLCMQDSVLIDTIYSAIANTAVCNKEEAPNYNEFKYAVNEALRTAKQRYRNRQKKSENNDTSKKHDKVFPKYHARYQRYNNDRDTDQSEEGDERCDIMDNDN